VHFPLREEGQFRSRSTLVREMAFQLSRYAAEWVALGWKSMSSTSTRQLRQATERAAELVGREGLGKPEDGIAHVDASSAEFVGHRWLRKASKIVIQGGFGDFVWCSPS
jgi:hypothetical protein